MECYFVDVIDRINPKKKKLRCIKYKPTTLEVERISTYTVKWSCIDLRVMQRREDTSSYKDIRFCLKSERLFEEIESYLNHNCVIQKVEGDAKHFDLIIVLMVIT